MPELFNRSLPATLRRGGTRPKNGADSIRVRLPGLRHVRTGALADATRALAVLVEAGINLHDALLSISKHADVGHVADVFADIAGSVRSGRSLSDALSTHPHVFSSLYVQLVRVGEESGILGDVLTRVADYLEASRSIRQRIRSALAYPVLILTVAAAATIFLLVVIVPTFAEMYRDYDAGLPGPTKLLLDASSILTDHVFLILVACGSVAFLVIRAVRIPRVRSALHRGVLHLPVVGSYVRTTVCARFCRNLGTLVTNRVPLDDALRMLRRTVRFHPLTETVDNLLRSVTRGRPISSCIAQNEIFSGVAAQMISAGEESGELDKMLLHVAVHLEEDLERRTDSLLSLMEPVVILVIGAVLGSILVALYLPLFELSQVVG